MLDAGDVLEGIQEQGGAGAEQGTAFGGQDGAVLEFDGGGGGAGVGLDLNVTCYTVAHDTIINPSDMKDTMGLPTMKPMTLSSLTGFCQCANAHVDAPAKAGELDAIDYYLNSGFFIE